MDGALKFFLKKSQLYYYSMAKKNSQFERENFDFGVEKCEFEVNLERSETYTHDTF